MGKKSLLVWNGKSDALYREARKQITLRNGSAPKTAPELDFDDFFTNNPDSLAYFPVFEGTTGWWGELLGTTGKIRSKMIISPECQMYEIGAGGEMATGPRRLYAAEVPPRGLKKIRETQASVKDMIATDSGTILMLLVGSNENKIKNSVNSTGGEYYGSLGGY